MQQMHNALFSQAFYLLISVAILPALVKYHLLLTKVSHFYYFLKISLTSRLRSSILKTTNKFTTSATHVHTHPARFSIGKYSAENTILYNEHTAITVATQQQPRVIAL